MPKIRNIIIFAAIATVLVLIYVFFVRSSPDEANLISSPSFSPPNLNTSGTDTGISSPTSLVAKDFLTLLLNVKNIKLNDSIFSDPGFNNLRDSSITLTPDENEGRPNPFAKFGSDDIPAVPENTPAVNENGENQPGIPAD